MTGTPGDGGGAAKGPTAAPAGGSTATRYVVLLKGINVGGNKKVPMAELRDLLRRTGFTAVASYLNSGNALVTSPDGADDIAVSVEQALRETFGIDVRCLVRTGAELRAVIAAHPFAGVADHGSRMFAHFLSAVPDPALARECDVSELAPGRVVVGDRVIYQWCPDGLMASPDVAGFVEKRWKLTVTARNWNTVSKLAELLS